MVQTAIGMSGKYVVGVLLAPNLESVDRRTADTLAEAAGVASKRMAALSSGLSFRILGSCSGPVEIVAVREDLAQSIGPSALLSFVAISVNAAVINSPVPGLDGDTWRSSWQRSSAARNSTGKRSSSSAHGRLRVHL
ncbi:unnamed protein product [Ectocarpus sp. 6 AP-2014]